MSKLMQHKYFINCCNSNFKKQGTKDQDWQNFLHHLMNLLGNERKWNESKWNLLFPKVFQSKFLFGENACVYFLLGATYLKNNSLRLRDGIITWIFESFFKFHILNSYFNFPLFQHLKYFRILWKYHIYYCYYGYYCYYLYC